MIKSLSMITKVMAMLFLVITFTQCQDDDDQTDPPAVVAGFTFTASQETGEVTFINTSENASTFAWDFGNGESSTEESPVVTFESGTYTVELTASNAAGTSNTFSDEVVIMIPGAIGLPITFDDANVDYMINTFNGVAVDIVENPDPTGSNDAVSNVLEITNVGAAFEGCFFELGMPIDLSEQAAVKMDVWSTSAVPVLVKLEQGTAADIETAVNHTGEGWEELTFNLPSDASYDQLTLFVDGPGMSAGAFYVDNIEQTDPVSPPVDTSCMDTMLEFPIDFDCGGIDYAAKIVGNVNFTVVDNPVMSGINNEETKVGQITNVGQTFENAFFNLDTPLDFNDGNAITFKFYSTQAVSLLLKFEDGTAGDIEVSQDHTGSGWEELTFPFSSMDSYNDMVLFVDAFGTIGGVFYIDEIDQSTVIVSTDCTDDEPQSLNGTDFNLTFETNPMSSIIEDGTSFSWIDNPDDDNMVNTSCKVGQIMKQGNNPWDNTQIDLDAKLDFDNNGGFRIKVWSGTQNTEVRIKLEEIGNPDNNVELAQNMTMTNAWEELTFPFDASNHDRFDKIVIFFDLNANNTDTYFFDDLRLYEGQVPPPMGDNLGSLPATFEDGRGFQATFEGATIGAIVANPAMGTGNMSANVYRFEKPVNTEFYGGMVNLFPAALDMTSTRTFKVKVYSSKPNAVVQFELKTVPNDGSLPNYSLQQTVTNANEWTELTFDFGAVVPADFNPAIYNEIVIIPDFDPANNPTASGEVYLIDDIVLE